MTCLTCGKPARPIAVARDGAEVASGFLCDPCLDAALAGAAEWRRQSGASFTCTIARMPSERMAMRAITVTCSSVAGTVSGNVCGAGPSSPEIPDGRSSVIAPTTCVIEASL